MKKGLFVLMLGAIQITHAAQPVDSAQYPKSGEARELDYGDTIYMDSTDIAQPIKKLCEQAYQGLMLLDKAALEQCEERLK